MPTTRSATWSSSRRRTARATTPAWCANAAPTGCCSTSTTRWPARPCVSKSSCWGFCEGKGVSVDQVLLAEPRGFCAGVDRAIEIVERALVKYGAPIYVRHEIVHNTYVVNDLKAKGAIFIEDLADVPPGATLVFSAHGVSKAVQAEAQARGFEVFDATCPLVTKVHVEVAKLAKEGYEFIMIGHKGHPEVEGTMGQLDRGIHLVEGVEDVAHVLPAQTEKLAVVTQTTLSVDDAAEITAAVRARFPQIREP